MALLGSTGEEYTKTGKGMLSGLADKLSYIPLIGGMLAFPVGMLSTVLESARWLFQGDFSSALTVLAAGTVGSGVDALTSFGSPLGLASGGIGWWLGNAASGMATGAGLGTHARAATEALMDSSFGLLGQHPTVLASYPAGIGSIGSTVDVSGKDNFRDKIAAERGVTRAQMDARADQAYVNQLQSNTTLGA